MILRTMKLGDVLEVTDLVGMLVAELELVQTEHEGVLEPIVHVTPGPLIASFDLGVWPINERKVRVAVRGDSLKVEHHRSAG